MSQPLNILLFADDRHPALTLIDHIKALALHSRDPWFVLTPTHHRGTDALNLRAFDAIAIHYSVCVIYDHFLPPAVRRRITRYERPKLQFVQDEYRWVRLKDSDSFDAVL